MKTLIVSLLLLFGQERQACLKLDIVALVDFSTSVQGHEGYIFSALSSFADSFQMDDDGVRIGVVAFNSTPTIPLEITGRRKEFDNFILRNNLFCTGTTNIAAGLKTSYEQLGILYEGLADRSDAKKIIVIVSDGEADDENKALSVANDIKSAGIDIWGVLILSESAKPAFMKALSSPNRYVETDYERLGEELNRLNFCL